MRFRALVLFIVILTTVAIASCTDDIQARCPVSTLCPQETPPLQDTTIDAVTYDTSIAGFPPVGFESSLLLEQNGDSLDARIVTRFDTLPKKYSVAGQDSAIVEIDSAWVQGRRVAADSTDSLKSAATVEAYDVTDAADTTTAALLAQFTPANKIGSVDLAKGARIDTLMVPLDTARVRMRVTDTIGMRIALRMVSTGSAELRFISQNAGEGFHLVIRPTRDTSVVPLNISPNSNGPAEFPSTAFALGDFALIASAKPSPNANVLRVGGYPWRRTLMRFKLPSKIVDSSAVIRATLFLTQSPSTAPRSGDTVYLRAVPILSSSEVTDPSIELEFAASAVVFPADSVALVPRDSGRKEVDIVRILRAWRGQDTLRTPRSIGLLISTEEEQPNALDFFSIEAPIGVRPQLRITYATKPSSGRP